MKTVSNSQNPALHARVAIHGDNGASIGEQTQLTRWQQHDRAAFEGASATERLHRLQIDDFLSAVNEGRNPLVDAAAGRNTVELFTAIYRSQECHAAIQFP